MSAIARAMAPVAVLERVDGDEPEMGDGEENDLVDGLLVALNHAEGTYLR